MHEFNFLAWSDPVQQAFGWYHLVLSCFSAETRFLGFCHSAAEQHRPHIGLKTE